MISVLLLALVSQTPKFTYFEPVQPPRKVEAMVHRGLWRVAPENTRPAIEAAVQHGIEWVEVDVHLTKDGQHVLIHDSEVDGVTDGTGLVRDKTLAELLKLDAGSWFARRFAGTPLISLETALTLGKGRVNFYLDCKRIDPKRLVEDIRSAGMENQVVIYDDPVTLEQIEAAVGMGRPIPLMKKWHPARDGQKALTTPKHLAAVEVDTPEITPEVCRTAHAAGLKIQAKALGRDWDTEPVWGKLVDAGVDWIQTDWPIELYAFLINRQHPKRPVLFSCHRGADRQAPENTLAAIEAAIAMKADFVELDVRTTKDGRFVLMHDGGLNRTTNGVGPVRQANFDDIRKLDAGAWFGTLFRGAQVPTLDEGLKALKGRARFYCDAKDIDPKALSRALREHGMLEDTVVYGSEAYLRKLQEADPEIKRMPPLRKASELERVARELKPYAFDTEWTILSKELVDQAHARGIKIFSDALGLHETTEAYERAITIGVDLIQTDFPDRVLRAIERHESQR